MTEMDRRALRDTFGAFMTSVTTALKQLIPFRGATAEPAVLYER